MISQDARGASGNNLSLVNFPNFSLWPALTQTGLDFIFPFSAKALPFKRFHRVRFSITTVTDTANCEAARCKTLVLDKIGVYEFEYLMLHQLFFLMIL